MADLSDRLGLVVTGSLAAAYLAGSTVGCQKHETREEYLAKVRAEVAAHEAANAAEAPAESTDKFDDFIDASKKTGALEPASEAPPAPESRAEEPAASGTDAPAPDAPPLAPTVSLDAILENPSDKPVLVSLSSTEQSKLSLDAASARDHEAEPDRVFLEDIYTLPEGATFANDVLVSISPTAQATLKADHGDAVEHREHPGIVS